MIARADNEAIIDAWWRETVRCRICPALSPWRKFAASNHGAPNHGLMILGEAPGRISLDNGRRFSNPRNLTIRRAFARAAAPAKIEIEELFYMTDTVKCWPPSPTGANRSPTLAEERTCVKLHLMREIELLKPRLIFAFGARASRAALGYEVNLSLEHGKAHRGVHGIRVIPLMHPSTANIAGMKRAGIGSLAEYEDGLAWLMRTELKRLERGRE
ncbi:MAG: uracil-DNA glycosylase family protein [Candidatus Binataceae bacterium]